MKERKANPSKVGLGSSQTEGQGTTVRETGRKADSSRKKQKRY
ncbi:YuzL family protein [Radiobacillus kanasensis]|nr:YuzL family protein [Radiobacillus kanasensis]UFU00145.1 YuzL family protein [Radiobacillus kanasensis]